MTKLEQILKEVDESIEKPMITPKFGDNWRTYAKDNMDVEMLAHIAWKQGRKAILLERKLKELLGDSK